MISEQVDETGMGPSNHMVRWLDRVIIRCHVLKLEERQWFTGNERQRWYLYDPVNVATVVPASCCVHTPLHLLLRQANPGHIVV